VVMKGVGVTTATIPIVKVKVVTIIVHAMKVEVAAFVMKAKEVATLVMKAKEVAATTFAIKVEVAKKKQKVNLLKLKMNEDNGRKKSWGMLHDSQRFGGKGVYWSSEMGLGRLTCKSLTHTNLHKPNNRLVSA